MNEWLPAVLLLVAVVLILWLGRNVPWREKWENTSTVKRDSILRVRSAEDAAREGARVQRDEDVAP